MHVSVRRQAEPMPVADPDHYAHAVKMIRKLRWIGREDEARQLERELRSCKGGDTVVATPRETD